MPRIVRFHETGAADVLKLEDLPLTEPGEGEVRLKVEAIGLNRAEVMFRQGQYLQKPDPPSRIGYEAAGVWLPNFLQVVWWRFNAWGALAAFLETARLAFCFPNI